MVEGREGREGRDIHIYMCVCVCVYEFMTDLHCCTAETNTKL